MGVYGTSPKRVAISMIVTWGFFTVVYTILSKYIVLNSKAITKLPSFFKSAYYSIIIFLTIGYGDYVPTGIIRLFSGLEGFVGLFLMAYFTVTVVRKVLR